MITGKTLIAWGYKPGPWFERAIEAAANMEAEGMPLDLIISALNKMEPPRTLLLGSGDDMPVHMNILPEMDGDAENIAKVAAHMKEIMRLPTVVAGAVMPDSCPSGSDLGTIPVGGVVASTDIHPGMHSADICCSMAATYFDKDTNPTDVLDAGMKLSHFGWGGRPRGAQIDPPGEMLAAFEGNPFLADLTSCAREHFATQGDGNHFFYVGRLASDGRVVLVTHHGSRKPGAMLYKAGMAAAEKARRQVCPEAGKHNAWIKADSRDGEAYWSALQIIRAWTKASHFAIHDMVAEHLSAAITHRFWNEHNFVFRKPDGLFYHAKGATPAFPHYAADASGLTLIPLNMAEPILVTSGSDAPCGLGFAPHGAGRNLSRTAYMKMHAGKTAAEMFAEQAPGIDARSFSGVADVSELPGAYKSAAMVRRQIEHFGLATVVDTIEPVGSIMAGQQDEPWRRKRAARDAAKAGAAQ